VRDLNFETHRGFDDRLSVALFKREIIELYCEGELDFDIFQAIFNQNDKLRSA
jgi:hypothetical protein